MSRGTLEMFERDGFVVIDELLWPEECDELYEASIEFTENLPEKEERVIFSSADKTHLKKQYFFESNDKIRPFFEEGALDEQGNLKVDPHVSLNKVGHALHLLHPLFRCYTYCHRVKTVVKSLGMVNPAVAQSMVIYKNPGLGSEVMAHQDSTYLYTEPVPPIGFWIALEDANVENGCLWIAPGSHKSGVHRRWIRSSDNSLSDNLGYDKPLAVYPENSFISVPIKKGSCIALHGNVVHKSAPNTSDKSRLAYTFHVIEKHNNTYAPDNWLQEGPGAPFHDYYDTLQFIHDDSDTL